MPANEVQVLEGIGMPDLGPRSTLEANSPEIAGIEAAYLARIGEKLIGRAGMPGKVDVKGIQSDPKINLAIERLIGIHGLRRADESWVRNFALTRAALNAGLRFMEAFGEDSSELSERLRNRGPSKIIEFLEQHKNQQDIDLGQLALRYLAHERETGGRFTPSERIQGAGILLLSTLKYQEFGSLGSKFWKSLKDVFGNTAVTGVGRQVNERLERLKLKAQAYLKLVPRELLEIADELAFYVRPIGVGDSDNAIPHFDDYYMPSNSGYRWRQGVIDEAKHGEVREVVRGCENAVYETAAKILDVNSYASEQGSHGPDLLTPPFLSPRMVVSLRVALQNRGLVLKRARAGSARPNRQGTGSSGLFPKTY